MTEWGVVGVIAALAGLAVTFSGPALKLNAAITRLAVLVEELTDRLAALEGANAKQHGELSGRVDELRGQAQAHETRITVLEMGGKKGADV